MTWVKIIAYLILIFIRLSYSFYLPQKCSHHIQPKFPLCCCKSNWCPAAAAAQSLQSCPTLCDPTDGSPPGSPVPGILQARTLEWVAISFSNAWLANTNSYCSYCSYHFVKLMTHKLENNHDFLMSQIWTAGCQHLSFQLTEQLYRDILKCYWNCQRLTHIIISVTKWSRTETYLTGFQWSKLQS